MDFTNQPQGMPVNGGQQAQADRMNGGYQAAQPQPGGFYQFQPGIGFVQVQGSQTGMGTPADMGGRPGGDQANAGTAAASAQTGMFGQGMPESAEPKFDQNKIGQMYGVMTDVMNGDADPAKLIGLFSETGGDFWKGALVGAAAVVLLNNNAVKGAVAGVVGSIFGSTDPEGEQVTVDGK